MASDGFTKVVKKSQARVNEALDIIEFHQGRKNYGGGTRDQVIGMYQTIVNEVTNYAQSQSLPYALSGALCRDLPGIASEYKAGKTVCTMFYLTTEGSWDVVVDTSRNHSVNTKVKEVRRQLKIKKEGREDLVCAEEQIIALYQTTPFVYSASFDNVHGFKKACSNGCTLLLKGLGIDDLGVVGWSKDWMQFDLSR